MSAPSPSSLSQSSSQSSSISIVTPQPQPQQQQLLNIPQSPQQVQGSQQHLLASPIHMQQQANVNNLHGGLANLQTKSDSSQSVMIVANSASNAVVHNQQQMLVATGQQQPPSQQVQGGVNYMLDMPQQQNLNEMMIVGGGVATQQPHQQQQQQVIHMQSQPQTFQPKSMQQQQQQQHPMDVLGQVKNATDARLSPLTLHKEHSNDVLVPSNTGISSPHALDDERIAFQQRSSVSPSSMAALSFSSNSLSINHNQSTLHNNNLTTSKTTTTTSASTATASNHNILSSSVKATLPNNNNNNQIAFDEDTDLVVEPNHDKDECAGTSSAPRTCSVRTQSGGNSLSSSSVLVPGSGNVNASVAPVNSPAAGASLLSLNANNTVSRRVAGGSQQLLDHDDGVEIAPQHGTVHYQSTQRGTKDASPPPTPSRLEESISSVYSASPAAVFVNSNQVSVRKSTVRLSGGPENEDHSSSAAVKSHLSQNNAAPNEIRLAFHQATPAEAPNPAANMNIVVSHPISQFMKNLTIGAAPRQPGIILPQTQFTIQQHQPHSTPQFLIHQHPPAAYHPLLHSGLSGPAPNVTVNPNGNFQTNPNATIRATYTPFRAFGGPLHTINNFGRLTGPTIQTQLQQQGIQSPILAAQLQTINQIATAQMQSQQQFLHIQGGGGSLEHAKKNVMPIFVSTTLHQPINSANVQMMQKASSAKDPLVALKAAAAASTNEGHSSPLSSSTASPMSASSSSPSLTKAACSIESSTPSPQSSSSSIIRSMTPQPDQNIRVLTPSEIMRTLPSIPNQDAIGNCGDILSHSHDSRSRSSDSSGDQVDSGSRFKFQPHPHGTETALIVAATVRKRIPRDSFLLFKTVFLI